MDTENRYYQLIKFNPEIVSFHKIHKNDHAKWRAEHKDAVEISEPFYREMMNAYFDLLKKPEQSSGPTSKI